MKIMANKKLLLPLIMIVLVAVSLSAVSATDYTVSAGSNSTAIQEVFDGAAAGDTVIFEAGEYKDIDNVVIDKQLNINGAGANQTLIYGLGNGESNVIFNIKASDDTEPTGTTISNIGFVMTQANTSKANDNGYGIQLTSVYNVTITDCSFYNGSAGIYVGRSYNTVITNNYFTGITETLTHTGRGEKGAKSINVMGGSNTLIDSNVFEGNVLDAISVASQAQIITVSNNYIKNASYGMFYGGGVAHVDIINNTFEHGIADAISLTKSCRDTLIEGNKFIDTLTNQWGSTIIYAEPGNTAHGYPSTISNITIINNEFEAADEDVETPVVAFRIYNQGTGLSTDSDIVVANNTYSDVTPYVYMESAWGSETDLIIKPTSGESNITPGELSVVYNGNITATLTDSAGNAIVGQHILVTIKNDDGYSKTLWATTDYDGAIQIAADLNVGTYTVEYNYAGSDKYDESSATSTVEVTAPEEKLTTNFVVNDFTGVALSGTNLTGVLTDGQGNVLAGQHVVLTLTRISSGASRDYTTTTDYNGEFQFPIFLAVGEYHAKAVFAGNDVYASATGEKDFQTTSA